MSSSELDPLGLDGQEALSLAVDSVITLESHQADPQPNSDTMAIEPQNNEPPKRDLEMTAAEAFAILDRGQKGFFTAKDVEFCCTQANCKVFGSSNVTFRVSHYINRAFPKADPGSVTLKDFEEEWNGKPGSPFRVLIYKHKQDSSSGSAADKQGGLSRSSSDSDSAAPIDMHKQLEGLPRRTSAPTPRSRRRLSDPYDVEAEAQPARTEARPTPSILGSISYKTRQGLKEGVIHDDGIRIKGSAGRMYLHVTEFVRTAPYAIVYDSEPAA